MGIGIAAALALLAGCGSAEDQAAADGRAPAGFRPPPAAAPTPLAGLGQDTPLADYVGRYPSDALAGVLFLDRTEAASALNDAVGDAAVRRTVIAGGTEVPIFRTGNHIAMHACEPHNCGDHHWTLLVPGDRALPALCYHHAAVTGRASRWYEGGAPVLRPGGCPSA